MKLPVSWLAEFIDLTDLPIEEIARLLTLAGLEVEEIAYAGLPMPQRAVGQPQEFKIRGIAWNPEKFVVAEVREVLPHPNADRLTLLDLFDGRRRHTVLTGAPNIFHLKGQGRLATPLKVAYAREGAVLYDGHAEGQKLTTLKRAKIRGVESYSMACSEKELGISDEHEGIILLDSDAPAGKALADYMGDAVLDVAILPNMARCTSVVGVARELAALTGRKLIQPRIRYKTSGSPIKDLVSIQIKEAELNPRFVLGLVRDIHIGPSPYVVQRRLRLAGIRPINNIVDSTNYAMLELGEPLHAFDFDVLQARAGKKPVKIITRPAREGESLKTLDGVRRELSPRNILVCDAKGPLSIAGVMGGAESEVTDATRNVLLEGAAWNFINIRRTAGEHNLPSEASYRFSRGVHPALALPGVQRGLQYMALWAGGSIAPGLVDEYALKSKPSKVSITPADVKRLLGIELSARDIARRLEALEFKCTVQATPRRSGRRGRAATLPNPRITVTAPPHRMDIGTGIVGVADVMEELARMVGYDRLPTTSIADPMPPQIGNPAYEWEQRLRDLLVNLGFDELMSYRLTSIEREALLDVTGEPVRIENPIAPERSILRRSLLASVLDGLERNARWSERLGFFEIGPVFEPRGNELPRERQRLALAITGPRNIPSWDREGGAVLDFFDLKGRLQSLLRALHVLDVDFEPTTSAAHLHPGRAATLKVEARMIGELGELHPLIKERYDFGAAPVVVADLDLDLLRNLQSSHEVLPVPEFPPVLEDIAVVVDELVPAGRVEDLIGEAGGEDLASATLFDVYRGEQIGAGRKSLAYSLAFRASDRTLTDGDAAAIRNRIVKRLQREVGATLRG